MRIEDSTTASGEAAAIRTAGMVRVRFSVRIRLGLGFGLEMGLGLGFRN